MFNLQIYDYLLRFQFFQGLSRTELQKMAGNTKFGFIKEESGSIVVEDGTHCQQLFFLIKGSLSVTTRSDDGGYHVTEQLSAPWVIQPEALFGAQPRFTSTYRTASHCQFITLSKTEMLRLIDNFLIIRLNLLNMLSSSSQRKNHCSWRSMPRSLRERFIRFALDHSIYPSGTKELHILLTRLAGELGDSRYHVSRMLHQLQKEELLLLHRGRIEIPSLERLLQNSTH